MSIYTPSKLTTQESLQLMRTSSLFSIHQNFRRGSRASLLATCSSLGMMSMFPSNAAVFTWDGVGSNDSNWSTKQNWSPQLGPQDSVDGDDLVFSGIEREQNNNDLTNATILSITFQNTDPNNVISDPFVLGGNQITLAGNVTNNSVSVIQSLNLAMVLNATRTFTTTSSSGSTAIGAAVTGGGGVTISGNGTIFFNATNGYTGNTAVTSGRLNVKGSIASQSTVSVSSGAVLGGDGVINGNVTIDTNGTLDVAFGGTTDRTMNIAGTLTSSGGALAFRVGGELATERDMLTVGTLNLNSSTLNTFFTDGSVTIMGSAAEASLFVSNPTAYTGSSVYQIISGSNTTGMFTNAQIMDAGLASALGLAGTQYTITSGGQNFWVTNQSNGMYLVAVPEPSVTLLSMFGMLGLVCRRRR